MKKAIARQGGRQCRQIVYNHLQRAEPFPRKRRRKASKLDPHKEYIRARLERFDLPATVLFRELAARGYQGGLSILRDYLRPLKQEFILRLSERFETLPGQQAQMDCGECGTIEVAGERKTLYVFVVVLGYSRMMYARFTTSWKRPVLLHGLSTAFERLGIPAELLVDNMKQAVDQHEASTGTVHWNPSFLAFADHHGFLPVAAPPYWPRVKGKVERGVGYVKSSFLEGRAFVDLTDLNRQLEIWVDTVANVRVHGTTQTRPVDRHAGELPHLGRWRAFRSTTCSPSNSAKCPPTATSVTTASSTASIRKQQTAPSWCAPKAKRSARSFACTWARSGWPVISGEPRVSRCHPARARRRHPGAREERPSKEAVDKDGAPASTRCRPTRPWRSRRRCRFLSIRISTSRCDRSKCMRTFSLRRRRRC